MEDQQQRMFDLGDVLSITTGRLVSPRLIEGVYDILNFMTGDNLYTHQLPRAGETCKPVLLAQHPDLANVDASTVTSDNWREWLDGQRARFGDALTVTPLAEWTHIDPMLEAETMVGDPNKIIKIEV